MGDEWATDSDGHDAKSAGLQEADDRDRTGGLRLGKPISGIFGVSQDGPESPRLQEDRMLGRPEPRWQREWLVRANGRRMGDGRGGPMIVSAQMLALFLAAIAGDQAHHRQEQQPPPPMSTALASWYDDSGTTASGRHYTYGFASLLFGSDWGRRVRFCYRGCAIGELDDHGPYVANRLFDLNWNLKTALGCPDLCWVRYR